VAWLSAHGAAEEHALRRTTEFEDFYQASYGRLVALLLAVLGDRQEAEDAAQEAFVRALARWPRLSTYDLPEAWVRRVALRLAVDSGRRLRRTARLSARLRGDRQKTVPEPGEGMAFSALGSALMRLPLREREVLVLHYFADMTAEHIAAERGLPAGTVKARLVAGRRRLERELAADAEAGAGADAAADPEEARDAR
jgi:RNA polymerase sigma-70 factor (ECF subfamily)